jgi:dTDP-4-amino-4,6-dideoxygalactose transaminase
MDRLQIIADEHGLIVLEDASQAHGARCTGRRCGSLGDAAAFSFHPQANLGACGDAGAVVTDDEELADRIRRLRNYGSVVKYHHEDLGVSSQLDAIQAAILRIKLRHLERWNDRRRQLAEHYQLLLADLPLVPPAGTEHVRHVYHRFVIRCAHRDRLLNFLAERNVHAGIHYPVPIHWQPAYEDNCIVSGPLTCTESLCGELLSLPMHPHMTFEEVETVVEGVRAFFDQMASAYMETRVGATLVGSTS